jgi:hypothetical protein
MLMREWATLVPHSAPNTITPATPQRTPSSAMMVAVIHPDECGHFRTHAPLQFQNSRSPRGWWLFNNLPARAINSSGKVSPRALAVLRLMTSSNLDGCAMRRSRRRIQHSAAIGSLALQVSNVENVRIFCGFPDCATKLVLARAKAVAGIRPLQLWTSGMIVAGLCKVLKSDTGQPHRFSNVRADSVCPPTTDAGSGR